MSGLLVCVYARMSRLPPSGINPSEGRAQRPVAGSHDLKGETMVECPARAARRATVPGEAEMRAVDGSLGARLCPVMSQVTCACSMPCAECV